MADAPALGAGAPQGACRFDPDLAYQLVLWHSEPAPAARALDLKVTAVPPGGPWHSEPAPAARVTPAPVSSPGGLRQMQTTSGSRPPRLAFRRIGAVKSQHVV